MKPGNILFLTLFSLCFSAQAFAAPKIDFGIFNAPVNSRKLEIRLKSDVDVLPPPNRNFSAGIFTVRYLTSYNVTLSVLSSAYGFTQSLTGTSGLYTYYAYSFAATNNVSWNAGQEYVAAVLEFSTGGSGNGTFELITNVGWTNSNNANFYLELDVQEVQNIFYQPTASAPLPVELVNFNATAQPDKSVLLDWTSAAESNLDYYGVEHSINGLQFSQLGRVSAVGNSNSLENYAFIHANPASGKNYYRLRMVDEDATFKYSPVRTVNIVNKDALFTLSPNPTTGPMDLLVRRPDQYDSGLRYQITDQQGKLLEENSILEERTHFDLSRYPAGPYYLQILTDQAQLSQYRIVVTHK